MFEKLSERKSLLLIFMAVGLLFLGSAAARAGDQMSLHVLFTGSVSGRVEPSG